MTELDVVIAGTRFGGKFERGLAPLTVEAFTCRMPFQSQVIHVRWSGEGMWIPLGSMRFDVPPENATRYLAPGQVILYPAGISETEILIAYGPVAFASKAGALAGNHFLTLKGDMEALAEIGHKTLWHGAQDIRFR